MTGIIPSILQRRGIHTRKCYPLALLPQDWQKSSSNSTLIHVTDTIQLRDSSKFSRTWFRLTTIYQTQLKVMKLFRTRHGLLGTLSLTEKWLPKSCSPQKSTNLLKKIFLGIKLKTLGRDGLNSFSLHERNHELFFSIHISISKFIIWLNIYIFLTFFFK